MQAVNIKTIIKPFLRARRVVAIMNAVSNMSALPNFFRNTADWYRQSGHYQKTFICFNCVCFEQVG